MTQTIAVLPGDGIGPEIIAQAVRVLDIFKTRGFDVQFQFAPLGGAAYDEYGSPQALLVKWFGRNWFDFGPCRTN